MGPSSKSPTKRVRRPLVAVQPKVEPVDAVISESSSTSSTPSRRIAASTPANVLLEIASYYYSVPFSKPSHEDASNAGYYLGVLALERLKALRAMSQTCRSWRDALLPRLWKSVECGAVVRPESECQWFIQCADRLIKKCGGLADNPELAKYTRWVYSLNPPSPLF